MAAIPKINFAVVDVRDVAAAHVKAMTLDEAKGERSRPSLKPFISVMAKIILTILVISRWPEIILSSS